MTAGELIDALRAFDPDETVCVRNPCPMGDTSYAPVILVERCDLDEMEGFQDGIWKRSPLVVTNMSADCSPVHEIVQERPAGIGRPDAHPARTRLGRRHRPTDRIGRSCGH